MSRFHFYRHVTLKIFAAISILLMLIGLLPNYLPLTNYQSIFQFVFDIGVFCFILAYFLYALNCWDVRAKICAVLMVAIPLLSYSIATTKMTGSTMNILLYLVFLFCILAIISACLLYIFNELKKGIARYIFKRPRRNYGYFRPKLSYSIIGLLVVSSLAVNYGGITTFTNNVNGIFQSTPFCSSNSQSFLPLVAQVQTSLTNLISPPTYTTVNESIEDIEYINSIRAANGVNPIQFDKRVYNLALARVNDMDKYGYLDHTNPKTGTCAFSIKSEFGLTSDEFVAENAFGYSSSTGTNYYTGIEKDAINAWMSDRGHKYNMLYPHIAGAVACSSGGHCVFEGLNHDEFTNACYTAAQGEAFWANAPVQPYEHT